MKKSLGLLAAVLMMAAIGGLAAPTPALADPEELQECLHNCYIAYVVMTQQPGMYQACRANCIELYDNLVDPVDTPQPGLLRYS